MRAPWAWDQSGTLLRDAGSMELWILHDLHSALHHRERETNKKIPLWKSAPSPGTCARLRPLLKATAAHVAPAQCRAPLMARLAIIEFARLSGGANGAWKGECPGGHDTAICAL